MSVVWSCSEWDQLEEVIVGNPLRARFPTADRSTQVAEFPDRSLEEIPQGPFPQWINDETEEDLNEFVAVLEGLGVTVKRPDTWPHEDRFSTIHWESEGYYNYCPRDIMLVIGDQIIETPNVIRSRAQESFSYRAMMVDYLKSGAKWYSISPNLVVVDQDQKALIKLLEKQGIDVIRLKLRHSKMLGGGFHCVTLDIRRTGTLQRYFD
jgi:N-dimethylarginine dimethylaminohydrolase